MQIRAVDQNNVTRAVRFGQNIHRGVYSARLGRRAMGHRAPPRPPKPQAVRELNSLACQAEKTRATVGERCSSGDPNVAATTTADESALRAVADAMRDAAATASDHAAKVQRSASEAGPKALAAISRIAYTGAYVLAYGVVYATVFV